MQAASSSLGQSSSQLAPGNTHIVRQALCLSIWDGVFANLYSNLTGGVFLVGYMLALHASEVQIGLLATFPLVANVAQLFSAALLVRHGRRRPLALLSGAVARLLWFAIILVSFLAHSVSPEPLVLASLALVALSHCGTAVNNLAWVSWMADLVRERIRGRYFSVRNSTVSAVALLATIGGGYFLDAWKVSHPHGELTALRWLFFAAIGCGMVSLVIQARIYEPPLREGNEQQLFSQRVRLPLQDRNFRRFLYFRLAWTLGVYISGPFFAVYMLKYLNLSYATVTSLTILSSVADLLSVRVWGWLSDRYTNRAVLLCCSVFAACIPYGWLFVGPDSVWLLAWLHLQGGLFWSGIHLCTANLLLKIAPENHRSVYYSTLNATEGMVAIVSPIIGGAVLAHLPDLSSLMSFGGSPFLVIFFLSSTLRLLSLPLLVAVHESRERSLWEAVRVIRNVRAFTTTMGFNGLYHFWLRARRRRDS